MGKVNTAVASVDVDYSKFFKAENKEAEGFQKKLQAEFGLRLPTHTTTTVEDSNHNGIYGDVGDDKNLNGKKDRGEKATGANKTFTQADKPTAQYTVFELHKKTLSDHPNIVNFMKANGYAVYDIKRDGDNKPVKFLFVKSDQVAALRKDMKSDQKTRGVSDEGPRYAEAKPAPADKGTTSTGSGVHGEHPVNKHMKKQPTVAKQEPKTDSKRKVGSDNPVTGGDPIDPPARHKQGDETNVGGVKAAPMETTNYGGVDVTGPTYKDVNHFDNSGEKGSDLYRARVDAESKGYKYELISYDLSGKNMMHIFLKTKPHVSGQLIRPLGDLIKSESAGY